MGERIVIGNRTREIVKGYTPELARMGLMAAGRTTAFPPYEIARDCLRGGHLIATTAGEGEFRIDGKWLRSTSGSVFMAPPGAAEAFRPARRGGWSFCWLHTYPVFFESHDASKSQLIEADVTPFQHAIDGFIQSSLNDDFDAAAGWWVDLIRYFARSFMRSKTEASRLLTVWSAVAREPARRWAIDDLCLLANLSREQLRVHSRRETGRSPMQQVAHLRMQQAIEILRTCDYKLEVVAELVGYENAFAFSNAFLKTTGKRPSSFRSIE